MELKSFREILLKKAEGNPYLYTLIKYAQEDLIADGVIESLLKMAEPSAAMGRGANSALTHYAGQMSGTDVEQMRDALGHHVSHYKGALKAHHAATDPAQKTKLRSVADQHLGKIIPLMHLAGRAGKHSGGKMTLDYPSTTPWESNYTTVERHPHNGKLKEGTKDLGRRPASMANREKNKRAVPDYRYMEMAPHGGHASAGKMPHKGGYPFEEVQLGTPAKRDAGQTYLPIEDVAGVNEYTPHPFDQHPIHQIADEPEHKLTPEQKEKFMSDAATWKQGEHHKNWMQSHKEKYAKDPEGYKKRGLVKPSHHYEGLPLGEQPEEARAVASAPAQVAAPEAAQAVAPPAEAPKAAAPKAAAPEAAQAVAPPAEAPKAAAPKAAAPMTQDYDLSKPPEGADKTIVKHWATLPDEMKKLFIDTAGKK